MSTDNTAPTPARSDAPAGVYMHPQGLCESRTVGVNTRVWAFAHVLAGAQIGEGCNVCDGVFIENDVVVGNDVTLKCGVQLWDGTRIGDRVFIGPNATFTNDRFPRSKQYPEAFLGTVIEDDASIGANATILPGLRIGRGAMIGAGAVVTRNVPPHAVVMGNPGVITGFADVEPSRALRSELDGLAHKPAGTRVSLGVGACRVERLPAFEDPRGALTALEEGRGLPFPARRIFLVHGVTRNHVRGEHAHKKCEQFLVAAQGSVDIVLDDGKERVEVRLDSPGVGLYLAPMVWGLQYRFSPGSTLMVVASDPYDADDYIRDYDAFLAACVQGA